MPRNRMIKTEFWDDEKLSKVSMEARLIFIGLWNFSDDYGVVKGDPRWLKNHVLPYEDSVSPQKFARWLSELENIFIFGFESACEKYYFIKNFQKHQTINRPSQTRNPEPPDKFSECSMSTQGVLIDEIEIEIEREVEIERKENIYSRILSRLNEKTGKNFKASSKSTQRLINLRTKEGFTENDFFTVVNNQCAKWLSDPKMCDYLRPETLFGTKFESYLNNTPHPLKGRVSDITIKNIETLKEWERMHEGEE